MTMITRRAFLRSGTVAVFAAGFGGSPLFLNRAVAATTKNKKVLISIFQRGAMDGLMAVTPFNDPLLKKLRPRLAMSAAQSEGDKALIDLDGTFGLHPALSSFKNLFFDKRLAVIHGIGSPDTTRSHFDAQDYMETGTPGNKGTQSGWLNRVSGLMGHETTPFQSVAMTSALPRSLYGNNPSLAIADLNDFKVNVKNSRQFANTAAKSFEELYHQTSQQLLGSAGTESFEAIDMLSKVTKQKYVPANNAEYPNTPLGKALKQLAQLIKADVGLQIGFAESGGWDTHVQQGTVNGTFAQRARDLSGSIEAFWTDLGERYHDDVVLMTMTEFGRTVHENGSGGTDHGRGSCMFVLGNFVDGGKVHGSLAELHREELSQRRDIPVTTDFRSLFSEVAGKHLGFTNDAIVFPEWNGKRIELMKG